MGIALVILGMALHLFALIAMLLAGGNSARAEADAEKAAAAIFFIASMVAALCGGACVYVAGGL